MMNSALFKYIDFNSDLRIFTVLALVSQNVDQFVFLIKIYGSPYTFY